MATRNYGGCRFNVNKEDQELARLSTFTLYSEMIKEYLDRSLVNPILSKENYVEGISSPITAYRKKILSINGSYSI